ncbi:MAG: sialidase family protein [Ginsengibacter sp.]
MKRLLIPACCFFIHFNTFSQVSVKMIDSVKINESKNYGWFPSLQMLSTGELICDVSLDPDVHSVEGVWAYLISTDKGKTWGKRNTAGVFFREVSYTRDPPLKDGSMIMLAGYPLPGPSNDFQNIETYSCRLSKGGNSALFMNDVKIHLSVPTEKISFTVGKIKEAANMFFTGTIIKSPSYGWLTLMYGKLRGDKVYRTIVVKSADLKNWKYLSTIEGDKETDAALDPEGKKTYQGFCESRMIRLNDGRLFVVMRTGYANLIYKSWSSDDGKTWSTPVSIGFRGVKPSMMLMKNGLIALCTGRPGPVTLRFSQDNGKTWVSPIELNTAIPIKPYNYASTSYTGMVELEKNKIYVVYDQVNSDNGTNPESDNEAMNMTYGKLFEVSVK